MKKIFLVICGLVVLGTSCKRNITDLNIDPKNPSTAPSSGFFTNAQRTLMNTLTSSNVNLNIFRLIVQHWQETTYTDESNYDLATRSINDAVWNALYRDVLRDFQESKNLIPNDVNNPDVQKNQLAITDIMFRPKDNFWTDPEFSTAGTGNAVGTTDYYQLPPSRIYGATLNVTF